MWKANTYTVTYDANGGTGSTASSTHTYDAAKSLTLNGFARTGWQFLGWSTDKNASVATYTDGQPVKNLAASGNLRLYAVWKVITSNIYSFDSFKVNNTIGGGYGLYWNLSEVFDMETLKTRGYTMTISMEFTLRDIDAGSDKAYRYGFQIYNGTSDISPKLFDSGISTISAGIQRMNYSNVVKKPITGLTNNNLGFLFVEDTWSVFGIKTNEYEVMGLKVTVSFT